MSALITLSYVFLIAFALWCLRVVAAPVMGFPTVVVYVLQGLVLMVFSWGAAALRDLADTVFDIIATMTVADSETQASTEKKGGNNEIH